MCNDQTGVFPDERADRPAAAGLKCCWRRFGFRCRFLETSDEAAVAASRARLVLDRPADPPADTVSGKRV
jgi:hypothetical protein